MLSEFIVSILAGFLFLGMVSTTLLSLRRQRIDYYEISDRIALRQLERILLFSYDVQMIPAGLSFRYKGKECLLESRKERLLLRPGTQIYFQDGTDFRFMEKKGLIYLLWKRGEKEYEFPIGSQKGLSVRDFPDISSDGDELVDR